MPRHVRGPRDYLKLGDWNARCGWCGFKFKAGELRLDWKGFYKCTSCWEPRQPQDFVKGVEERMGVPWAQIYGFDYVGPQCTPDTLTAIPGMAGPGCFFPSTINPANSKGL